MEFVCDWYFIVDVISEIKTSVNRELESFKKQGIIKSGLEVDLSLQFRRIIDEH